MSKKEKFYEYRTIRVEGAYHHLFREDQTKNWIHHNSEGPAIEPVDPEDRSIRKQYYFFGFEKTLDQFKEHRQSLEGLPWYKNPSMKAVARF